MLTISDETSPDRLLKPEEAFEMLGLPTSSGWALVAAGRIPQPIKIGRRTRWSQRLLQTWIAEQSEAAQRQSPNRA
jgi:predicted DNA-binding transcriptional regulator AlpA